jgi:hypothetical protein
MADGLQCRKVLTGTAGLDTAEGDQILLIIEANRELEVADGRKD